MTKNRYLCNLKLVFFFVVCAYKNKKLFKNSMRFEHAVLVHSAAVTQFERTKIKTSHVRFGRDF